MPPRPYEDPEAAARIVARCRSMLHSQHRGDQVAVIARELGLKPTTVAGWLRGTSVPPAGFCVALGTLAGLPEAEVLRDLGLLPAAAEVQRATPTLPGAPLRAAEALLADPSGARRFETRLVRLFSGDRYPYPSHDVARFTLREGETALPYPQAESLAQRAAVGWRPTPGQLAADEPYWSVRLELRSRTEAALRGAGEHSWQGGPDTSLWRSVTKQRAVQALVQDPVAGTSTEAVAETVASTVVFVGGRPLVGAAAAMLAQALGLQYVLVRSVTEVLADGRLVPVRRDPFGDRTTAWLSVATHIRESAERGRSWPAVVLVRPYVFGRDGRLDESALGLLRETPARIVFCRPPEELLAWWAERQERTAGPAEFRAQSWLRQAQRELAAIGAVLSQRPAGRDLVLPFPGPVTRRGGAEPELPADLADAQARTAWRVLGWLETAEGPRRLAPSSMLAGWAEELRADPYARYPRRGERTARPR